MEHDALVRAESNLRWLIHRDVFSMVKASPWCGTGLGNFAAVFAMHRDATASPTGEVSQNLIIHPESDWLWLAAEMGLPGLLLVAGGLALFFYRALPVRRGAADGLRVAALVSALAFLLHSFADVSGHRIGTIWPAILVASLALPSTHAPGKERQARRLRLCARFFALALGVVGLGRLVASHWAGSPAVARAMELAEEANQQKRFDEAAAWVGEGLPWAPLRWEFYYQRGVARLLGNGPIEEAQNDFRRARFLQPHLVSIRLREGELWLRRDPRLTLAPWQEALEISPALEPIFLAEMLRAGGSDATVRQGLLGLARKETATLLVFLQQATPAEFQAETQRLLERNPSLDSLSASQVEALLTIWTALGDPSALAALVSINDRLLRIGWIRLAEYHAGRKEFQQAFEVARRFDPPRPLEAPAMERPLNQLRQEFLLDPSDAAKGLSLYQAQVAAGERDAAFQTLLRVTALPECPAHAHSWMAGLWVERGEWEKAWNSWRLCHRLSSG